MHVVDELLEQLESGGVLSDRLRLKWDEYRQRRANGASDDGLDEAVRATRETLLEIVEENGKQIAKLVSSTPHRFDPSLLPDAVKELHEQATWALRLCGWSPVLMNGITPPGDCILSHIPSALLRQLVAVRCGVR
jgi:hypothetical protein